MKERKKIRKNIDLKLKKIQIIFFYKFITQEEEMRRFNVSRKYR